MNEKQDQQLYEELTEIDAKLNQIHHNQEQLFEMLSELGWILTRFAKHGMVVHQEELKNERHKDIIDRYGETCYQKDAALILNVSPRTIARWIKEGRIRAIGRQVDVRSICSYLDSNIPKGRRSAKKNPLSEPSIKDVSDNPISLAVDSFAKEAISGMGEFERAARGLIGKREKT